MHIEKFTKKKNGDYTLSLSDNTKVSLHEDIILKYDLLLKREIDEEKLDYILSKNNDYTAYTNAIKYIGIRMRSIKEIKEYLKKKEVSDEVINEVVTKLKNDGYLNDLSFAKAYVLDKINLSNDGPKKIIDNLKKNNIKEEFIEDAISIFTDEIIDEKIEKLINKGVKHNSNKGAYLLKQKILNDLINLGYERSSINKQLSNLDIDDTEIYNKEYEKIKKKLSTKYSGEELEYRVKQKMYQKGFTYRN